jgi:hypothetical protein
MSSINGIVFCGGETAGSTAYSRGMQQYSSCNTNFRGYPQTNSQKESTSIGTVIGLTTIVSAASILGLAYAHKNNTFNKIENAQIKNILQKLEPAGKQCYEWCSKIKKTGLDLWNKVRGN